MKRALQWLIANVTISTFFGFGIFVGLQLFTDFPYLNFFVGLAEASLCSAFFSSVWHEYYKFKEEDE
jgi:hypothetical protein